MNLWIGCYVGCMINDYEMFLFYDIYDIGYNVVLVMSEVMIVNCVLWFFGFKGFSFILDIVCLFSLYVLYFVC